MLSGCSSDPKGSGPPPQPGSGQAKTYVISSDPVWTKQLALRALKVLNRPELEKPLTNDETFEAAETWRDPSRQATKDLYLHADYGDASLNFGDLPDGMQPSDYKLSKGRLEPVRSRLVIEKFLTDLGAKLDDFQVTFRQGDGQDPPSLDCTRMVEGTPVDSLLFPCGVTLGDGYQVVEFRLSARRIGPGWPVDVLSVEEAAAVDGRGVDVAGAKGRPVRVLTGVRVDDDRQVMVPAWSVPVLDAAVNDPTGSLGITLLAVSPDELGKLMKRFR
jgi:hypothetical protein